MRFNGEREIPVRALHSVLRIRLSAAKAVLRSA